MYNIYILYGTLNDTYEYEKKGKIRTSKINEPSGPSLCKIAGDLAFHNEAALNE